MKKVFKLFALASFTACTTTFFGCKKDAEIPTLTTTVASQITETTAKTGGKITSSGGADVTAHGVCWSTAPNPDLTDTKTEDGSGTGPFSSDITGLTGQTTYYVRAYATNSVGTAYGNQISFTSSSKPIILAAITTTEVTMITAASAVAGIEITDNGGERPTAAGVCWGTDSNPTTSNNKETFAGSEGSYASIIQGLDPATRYYIRAYFTNSAGTAYGNELSFTTSIPESIVFNPVLTYGTVSDIDGNNYKTIQIGNQIWMAENLATTKYNDGSSIPEITEATRTTDGYTWYNNDATFYKTTYGALYNWYAVTDSRNLCPAGWHVPTGAEWSTLATYLGDASVAGGKMKEAGITHWLSPNSGGFNESGFTALPGGWYNPEDGDLNSPLIFTDLGYYGSWWSATSSDPGGLTADYSFVGWTTPALVSNEWQTYKINGLSVRCVKDN